MNRCEGEGICDRITGVGEADWTIQEKWEEASPGCKRRCQQPPIDNTSIEADTGGEDDNDDFSDEETEYLLNEIEDMSDAFHAGEQLDPDDYEFWLWNSFRYWRKTERDFERIIQIKLGIVAEGFLKK